MHITKSEALSNPSQENPSGEFENRQDLAKSLVPLFKTDKFKTLELVRGMKIEFSPSRQITDFSQRGPEIIHVLTGAGALVNKEQDIFTTGLRGCAALFIQKGAKRELLHLTPTHGKLSYVQDNPDELIPLAEQVTAQLPEEMEQTSALIIVNLGTENGKKETLRQTILSELNMLREVLLRQAVTSVRIVETQTSGALVYSFAEVPNELLVIGDSAYLTDDGFTKTRSEPHVEWVSINGSSTDATYKSKYGVAKRELNSKTLDELQARQQELLDTIASLKVEAQKEDELDRKLALKKLALFLEENKVELKLLREELAVRQMDNKTPN